MQKIYLLLRNNKQSGPFTKEELLQQALRKHDLIWVEGRSAGWRSPEEIAELATEPQPSSQKPTHSQTIQTPVTTVRENSAKHIYISLPSGIPPMKEPETPAPPETAGVNEEEKQESFEERVLRMQQRVAAYNNSSAAPENKEQVETKYARSLDDIKEEYASWLHRQKKRKTRFHAKPMLTGAAALFAIAVVSFFILRSEDAASPAAALQGPGLQVAASNISQAAAVEEKIPAASKKTESKKPVDKKETGASRKIASVKNQPTRSAADKSTRASHPVMAKKEPETEEPALPLSRQIRIFGNDIKKVRKGIGDFQLTVQNNSRQSLKVVAVDVFYFGSNGRQLQKKTMYFSNLSPHRSLSLTAPGHKKATAVQYKLGLVSSDQGLYYAKQ